MILPWCIALQGVALTSEAAQAVKLYDGGFPASRTRCRQHCAAFMTVQQEHRGARSMVLCRYPVCGCNWSSMTVIPQGRTA